MKFCSHCASPLTIKIPADDSRERHVCEACGSIHYQNPRNVVGSIPVFGEQVLLCRRAIEPRLGYWTLPAGFMELGESTSHGAVRETLEEAGAVVKIGPLYSLLNVPHAEQVHLFYLATMPTPEFSAGEESLEVALFHEHEIPWDDLAFPTVKQTLEWFFADRAAGHFATGQELNVRSRDVLPSEKI
jgi:ADP-ribose pyrophosphatase YjhB (NUDIX family)